MNWDQIAGKWKQYQGRFKEKWGKLTDDDLQRVSGRRDQLVGIIQERYGIAKEEASKQLDAYLATLADDEQAAATSRQRARGAGRS
jgi:uncharacterized protein YjbJ (UPF0337 family)